MVVHIAPIGEHTEHVIEWIREVTPVTKLYLIHSKKTSETNFAKKARDLEKKIKGDYPGVEIIKVVIENPLNLDDTMDAITKIVHDERENGVENHEIAINVTGGTNVMAAAAILAATMRGTKAYYVLNRRKNPGQKSYVEELPIPPIGIVKMNETQQKILELISKGTFVLRHPDGKILDKQGPGVITNQKILSTMKWSSQVSSGVWKRQKGATRLHAIAKNLERKGYITILKEVPALERNYFGRGRFEYTKGTHSGVMYKITPAGRRQAKDAMMLKE